MILSIPLASKAYFKKIPLLRANKTYFSTLCILDKTYEELDNTASHFLHPTECAYLETLSHKTRRYSYLLGRYCAKEALKMEPFSLVPQDYAIMPGIFGQPIVISLPNVQVSIAHGDTIGAALAFPEEHPMGIDIEPVNNNNIAVIEKEMTPKELELVAKQLKNKAYATTVLWTAKEALSKIIRTGSMIPFQLLEISECSFEGEFVYTKFKNFQQYQACSFLVDHYVCSVVYPRKTKIMLDC